MPSVALAAVLALLLASCGAAGGAGDGTPPPPPPEEGCVTGDGPAVTVVGTVAYERLVLSEFGLGPAVEVRPARFVDVQVRLAGGGTCYGQGSADVAGSFSVVARPPAGSQVEMRVVSRTDNDPLRALTVHNALPPSFNLHSNADSFEFVSPSFTAGLGDAIDLVVPYRRGQGERPSIGFGLLDVLVSCSEAFRQATGTAPPLCHAYTRLGNNGATGTSFYDHATRALTVLGGAAGNLDASDTDYFDDAVVAHEYGHFIEFNLSNTLTRGGSHSGEALEPNFAWSEGQATGFGCLCRGDPLYIDSVTTTGASQINANVEDWPQIAWGIGSEETVAEIVWDLGDGAGAASDSDGDVAAVPLGALYGATTSFDPATDAPYIGLFLDRLVARGAIASANVATLLAVPEDQEITYPLAGDDVWPTPLFLPADVTGVVDGTAANPCRALVASRWYRFALPSSRTVSLDLAISRIPGSSDNVDLTLLAPSGEVFQRSANTGGAPEKIGPLTLAPGVWLVRVEASCGGFGNKAGFRLVVGP